MTLNLTWPEIFSSINAVLPHGNLVWWCGLIFLAIILLLPFFNLKRTKYFLPLWLIFMLALQLANILDYGQEIAKNSDLFGQSTSVRQDQRYCDLVFTILSLKDVGCPLNPLLAQVEEQVKPGSKLYIVPTIEVVNIYLRYRLLPKYQLVASPDQAQAAVFFLGLNEGDRLYDFNSFIHSGKADWSNFKVVAGDGLMTGLMIRK